MLSSSVWDVWARFGLSSRPVKASSRAWRLCGPHFLAQLNMGVCHQFILSIQPIHPKYPKKPSTTFANPIHPILIQFSSNSHPILIQFPFSFQMVPDVSQPQGPWGLGARAPPTLDTIQSSWDPKRETRINGCLLGLSNGFQWFPMVSMGDPPNVWFTHVYKNLQWKIHEHPIKVDEFEHVGTKPHGLEAISQAFREIFCWGQSAQPCSPKALWPESPKVTTHRRDIDDTWWVTESMEYMEYYIYIYIYTYIYIIESRGIHSILLWSCYMQVVGASFQGIPRYFQGIPRYSSLDSLLTPMTSSCCNAATPSTSSGLAWVASSLLPSEAPAWHCCLTGSIFRLFFQSLTWVCLKIGYIPNEIAI